MKKENLKEVILFETRYYLRLGVS